MRSLLLVFIFLFFSVAPLVHAEEQMLYLFYDETCPHCEKERRFLDEWQRLDPSVHSTQFEIYYNQANQEFFADFAQRQHRQITGVPTTVIGEQIITGYASDETTGEAIKAAYYACREAGCVDIVNPTAAESRVVDTPEQIVATDTISLPFFGAIDTNNFSLPLITILIAAVDGFNPCAMWVLVFLIGLLLGIENKKRRWLYGVVFLSASAVVYFLFMAAWLQLVLFLGFIAWLRIGIGVVSACGGIYSIREWWQNKSGICTITHKRERTFVFQKLRQLVEHHSMWFALFGIVLLAGMVNIVELVCSAGLPAVYTQVLALSDLTTLQYYSYLVLYILIFLLDDIIVFSIAMLTLEISGVSSKYTRYNHLIGGIMLLLLGLFLIFKPEWIMF